MAVAASVLVLVASRFPAAPLRDAATLGSVSDVYLVRPDTYVGLAPFSNVLDAITLLSERQDVAVVLGLIAIWALVRLARLRGNRQGWRENMRSFVVMLTAVSVIFAAAACLPRPMAYLGSADPDVLRIDFHSHTQNSTDARQTYSVDRNRAWHHAGGYDVAYLTDHHTFVGSEQGVASDPPTGRGGVFLLPGIETNWHGEHVGLLGAEQMDRRFLSADLHDIDLAHAAAASCCSGRAPIIVWNHPRDPRLASVPLGSGAVQAIEISNGALQAMDLVRWKRQEIVALARKENLALLSGTDSHGWGYAAPNWTLLPVKGWRKLDEGQLAARIEEAVRVGGFGATRVVERATEDPGTSAAALDFSVFLVPWRMLTELSPDERRMWLVWIWGIAIVNLQLRRYRRASECEPPLQREPVP